MTKYDLLQTLEMIYPDKKDWFVGDDDGTEGVVWICFSIEEKEDNNE